MNNHFYKNHLFVMMPQRIATEFAIASHASHYISSHFFLNASYAWCDEFLMENEMIFT